MRLTSDQLSQYWDKGWLVVEGVFPREEAERMAAFSLDLVNKGLGDKASAHDASGAQPDIAPDGSIAGPRKLHRPFGRDVTFRRFIFDSHMPDLVSQLTGQPPLLFTDQIFFKPPRHGTPKAYHQDNAYFLMHPDDHVVTAWIAMDDVDEANGCLRYIDGSHRGEILPCTPIVGREYDLTPDPSLIDLKKESLALVKKGGVVFHHSKALHCSGPNTSERWRRGYATHWIAPDVTGETNLIQTGYHLMPELFADLPGRASVVRDLAETRA